MCSTNTLPMCRSALFDSLAAILLIRSRRIYETQRIAMMLLAGVTCLKHEGFREEREWRAIYCPRFYPSPLMGSDIEVIGGVPQLVSRTEDMRWSWE
jgi:hypothetical protein